MYSVCDGDCDSDNTIVNSNGGSIYLGNWVYLGFGLLEIKQQGFKIFRGPAPLSRSIVMRITVMTTRTVTVMADSSSRSVESLVMVLVKIPVEHVADSTTATVDALRLECQ